MEVKEELKIYYNNIINKLDKKTMDTITWYTTEGYIPSRNVHQKNLGDFEKQNYFILQRKIKTIEKVLQNNPLPFPLTVYRGTCERAFNLSNSFRDNLFINKGFMSTSLESDVAYRFKLPKIDDGLILELVLPINFPGFYIKRLSQFPEEEEILLNHNMTYEIISKEKVLTLKPYTIITAIPKIVY